MANILEVSRVAPFSGGSPEYSLSLPLTLFDTIWFKFPPVERLFFYSLADPKETLLSSVVPRLKHSLSLTLRHFLPLAGTLTWPPHSPKPLILYRPPDGAVSLSVAESDDDFDVLCGDEPQEVASFRSLVPNLDVSETGASVVSLRVTIFPSKGFCVGVTTHHAVLDGKSTTMFVKSWAHLCREINAPSLPPELTPFLDRSVLRDPKGLDILFLNQWFRGAPEPRDDPKLFEFIPVSDAPSDSVRATFVLTRKDLSKLRQEISSPRRDNNNSELRLSTFVVAVSYVLRCIVKATENSSGPAKIIFGFAADFRRRMNHPIPDNYLGNCVGAVICPGDVREMIAVSEKEDGGARASLAAVAGVVSGQVRELEGKEDVMEGAEEWLTRFGSAGMARVVGVAGSPRFGVYGVDFGWGRPRKVEVASIDRTGAVSMAESRDGSGGVEVGVVLEKHHMDDFTFLFAEGLSKIRVSEDGI